MLKSLIFPALAVLVVGESIPITTNKSEPVNPELRIILGSPATIDIAPHQVFLSTKNSYCGGSIISEEWILTASHCVTSGGKLKEAENMYIRAGSHYRKTGGQVIGVQKVIAHEKHLEMWKSTNRRPYDIALLHLKKPLQIGPTCKPIDLFGKDEQIANITVGIISGWGLTKNGSTELLNFAQVYVFPKDLCMRKNRSRLFCEAGLLAVDNERGTGTCSGDSGGPLVIKDRLAGISCSAPINCDYGTDSTAYFVSVAYYRDWIKEKSGI